MPGLLRVTTSSSSSDDHDNAPVGSSPPTSDDGGQYPATSFPGYAEKPLNKQLEPIAVIGMGKCFCSLLASSSTYIGLGMQLTWTSHFPGCRLPGDVASASDFWDMMINKRTGQTPKVPSSRFNIDAHYHKDNDRPGSFGVLGGYFLNGDLSDFDPGLFNITPIEAMWMDPQQRKLLEVVYEALESAGVSLDAISGTRTAVFAASFTADWQQMAFKEPSFRHSLAATGVDPGIISNRISHVFNLNGPSILVNTACSSSVYALHNACNALRNNEAEGAIVGGVNLIITVDQHMNTAKLGVLSPTSTCHTFDESADGYGRADAVGAVYLKRLSDAVRDGDPIRGVIRSSAVNSNGKVPAVGITHPNREGQADVISHAYKRGGDLDPRLTGYFECHGTGTAVGDPLEVHAVSIAMNKNRAPGDDPLWIGAVKTNIGHSEAASGLSALIKAILIVERGIIPPTRGLIKPSPSIKWDEWQVKVPTEPQLFPPSLPVRRVSINSFGYGGTNAHVIVEGAETLLNGKGRSYTYIDESLGGGGRLGKRKLGPRRAAHRKRPFLLLFSAHDKATLQRNIEAHGRVAHKYDLLDLSYTLATRRSILSHKAFTVVSSSTLADAFSNPASSFTFTGPKRKATALGFVFTGQGAQWPRMGAELIKYSSSFLESIRALDRTLEDLGDGPDWSIEDVLLEDAETSPINEAEYAQPLCTAIQIALVQLLNHWGIRPAVTVGHSSGEIAAAYAAGLISAEEAITAAYYRGQAVRNVETVGAMLAVGLGAEAVERYLDGDARDRVVVACHNSPSGVTLSGDADALETVKAKLDADNVFTRAVKTNGKAYHSHHMGPVADRYEVLLRAAKAHRWEDGSDLNGHTSLDSTAKMVSSVTNSVLDQTARLGETYWSSNLRNPVLFNQAVQTILTSDEFADVDVFIEIGPHSAMAGPIKQIKSELNTEKLVYLPTLLRGADSASQLLNLVGQLFFLNYPVDTERVTSAYVEKGRHGGSGKGSTIVDLPPYQWNYVRPFWAENRASREQRQPAYPRHDVLGQLVIGSSLAEPTWRNVLRIRDLPWLKDHSLGGEAVFPAAGYFSMAIEAITQVHELGDSSLKSIESYTLRDVSIKKALVTPEDDEGIEVLFNLRPSMHRGEWWDFSVSSVDAEFVKNDHMAGSISINTSPRRSISPRPVPTFPQRASGKAWNQALRAVGFDYGPTFQDMEDIRFDGKHYEASCRTTIKQQVDPSLGESRYVIHPASVDSVLQLSIAAIYTGRTNAIDYGVVPIQVDEVTVWPPSEEQVAVGTASAYAWVPRRGVRSFEGSAQMTAHDGELVLQIVNVRTTSYEAAVPQKAETSLDIAAGPYSKMAWELDIDSLDTARSGLNFAVSDLISLALFKYPGLKVLELGAEKALEILQKHSLVSYTIAHAPDEEQIREVQASVKDFPNANVIGLDPTEDLESQSLKPATYDVMVISHTSIPSSEKLPAELLSLLKPGGYVLIADAARIKWEAADGLKLSRVFDSNVGASVWRRPLSTGEPCSHGQEKHVVQLIYRTTPAPEVAVVKSALESLGWDVSLVSLGSVPSAEHIILVADLEGPLLFSLTETEFHAIQTITNSATALLWITAGGILRGKHPEYALTQGLARSLSSEQATLDFRTLDVDLENVTPAQIAQIVARIARLQVAAVEGAEESSSREREFSLSDGYVYVSRLVCNDDLNKTFAESPEPEPTLFTPEKRIVGKIWTKGKVVFEQQQQQLEEAISDKAAISPEYVEVRVEASGLTREDVLAITGADYPTTFSHEIGGVVTKVGPGVADFKPGDRVVGFHTDRLANYQEVPAALLHKLGSEDDMTTAVSLLVAYANALYGLEVLANVQPKETVLILHKTGVSGIAAVKVAQLKGAIAYVVVETDEEVAYLRDRVALDENQIIRQSQGPVSARLDKLTNNRGADVIFSTGSSIDPSAAREAWRCIARFGRFVDAGRKDVLSRSALDVVPVSRGASYLPFDLLDLYEARPDVLSRLLPTIVSLFQQRSIAAPAPVVSIHLGDLDKAVSTFSESFGAAKSVVRYEASETPIQALPPGRTRPRFSADHTYLLVGCLGGLGHSLTAWMMESGARRFTFLSRSGTDSESAARLVGDIEAAGAIVQVIRGDATSREDVVRAVQAVSAAHPIRGVVHAAMVLRVRNIKPRISPELEDKRR